MYQQVETYKVATWHGSNAEFNPVATLEDEFGGKCQIAIDDHCYVVLLQKDDGTYKPTPWIFREAFEVLKTLPSLNPPRSNPSLSTVKCEKE
jgi:hypothetical protein